LANAAPARDINKQSISRQSDLLLQYGHLLPQLVLARLKQFAHVK
jgi:hypothetical protein